MSTKRTVELTKNAIAGFAARVRIAHQRRRDEQMIARLSARQIEDMGFERDWDGSIQRRPN